MAKHIPKTLKKKPAKKPGTRRPKRTVRMRFLDWLDSVQIGEFVDAKES